MNQREWKRLNRLGIKVDFTYYNKSHKLLKQFNVDNDEHKIAVHHLRDTEEQRKYNDERYELWGFEIDENGNEHFEYGKYVVFVTHDEHTKIHAASEETRMKIGEASRRNWLDDEYRNKVISANTGKKMPDSAKQMLREMHLGEKNCMYGKHPSDETNRKRSESLKQFWDSNSDLKQKYSVAFSGENNAMYGKRGKDHPKHGVKLSDETKKRIGDASRHRKVSEETRVKIGNAVKGKCAGNKNGMFGKHMSDDAKQKLRDTAKKIRDMYNKCIELGSAISFKEFKRMKMRDREQFLSLLLDNA